MIMDVIKKRYTNNAGDYVEMVTKYDGDYHWTCYIIKQFLDNKEVQSLQLGSYDDVNNLALYTFNKLVKELETFHTPQWKKFKEGSDEVSK